MSKAKEVSVWYVVNDIDLAPQNIGWLPRYHAGATNASTAWKALLKRWTHTTRQQLLKEGYRARRFTVTIKPSE